MEIADAYSHLYHYTSGGGLRGILESQQLWATRITHLNDSEEHSGFFDRRLPVLIARAAKPAFDQLARTPEGRHLLRLAGGSDRALKEFLEIVNAVKETTLELNEPYVVSFCGAPLVDPHDGLLSQWRGYGHDGGYALVFRTHELSALIAEESRRRRYAHLFLGDVEYLRSDAALATHEENQRNEAIIQAGIQRFIRSKMRDQSAFDDSYLATSYLACMHKHVGFREEQEVRLVAVRPLHALAEKMRESDAREEVVVQMDGTNGSRPYIRLFGNGSKLPIERIIVGPHLRKAERVHEVQALLGRLGLVAEVTPSGIPYLGR